MTDAPRRAPKFPLRLDQMATPRRTPVKPPHPAAPARPPAAPVAAPLLRPQQPLQHAAELAARSRAPTGLGMDSASVRRRMAERLRADGLRHEALLAALADVPRHRFVDAALVTQAYEDTSLPIGHGQTISKPSVVARMIELLLDSAAGRRGARLARVLEVGTGCGYQAALLARLARQVVSVERVKPLHDRARDQMLALGIANARLVYGDGMLGHPPNAPYDGIIAAAGGESLPQAWLDQLAPGGRIVAPVHDGGARQVLVVVDRTEDGFERTVHEAVQFVPLRSGLVR